jgi:Outer membrane protein Omp28/Secretion system C-terminal sorting domain/Cleaved Adhesin Domain
MRKFYTLLMAALFVSAGLMAQRDLSAKHVVSSGTTIVHGDAIDVSMSGLFESFETGCPPAGWSLVNPDGGTGWAQVAAGTTPLPGWNGGEATVPAGGGSYSAYCTWTTGGAASNDQWLITPAIDIQDGDILDFWLEVQNASTFNDYLEVLLSTTDAQPASFTETITQIDFTDEYPWTQSQFDLSAYAGQTCYIAFRETVADNQANGAYMSLDLVQVGTIEAVDATLVSINTPQYHQLGELNISGTLMNNGSDDITSYDVNYAIDGGAPSATYSITGVSIPLGGMDDFTHDAPYNFTSDGTYEIEVVISNVNGGGETNLDDNSLTKEVIAYTTSVQKKIILENFTTAECPNCPPVHTFLESYVSGQPNAILIAQHAGYYTDPMTIPENEELLALYNQNPFAPALCIDRFHYDASLTGGAPDPGPVFWPAESNTNTTARMDEAIATPAFVTCNIFGDYSDGTANLTIQGELIGNVVGDDLRLVVYITENGIVSNQSGGSSTYVHNNVLRDAISGTWGDAGIITSNTAGTTFSADYSYTIDPSWDANNMDIIVFVANFDNGDVNNRAILNAEEAKLTALIPLGIDKNSSESSMVVYPNPVSTEAKIAFNLINTEEVLINVYNILGKKVMQQNAGTFNAGQHEISISAAELNSGLYFIEMQIGAQKITRKIQVK